MVSQSSCFPFHRFLRIWLTSAKGAHWELCPSFFGGIWSHRHALPTINEKKNHLPEGNPVYSVSYVVHINGGAQWDTLLKKSFYQCRQLFTSQVPRCQPESRFAESSMGSRGKIITPTLLHFCDPGTVSSVLCEPSQEEESLRKSMSGFFQTLSVFFLDDLPLNISFVN